VANNKGIPITSSNPQKLQKSIDSLIFCAEPTEIRSPAACMEYLGGVSDGGRLLLPKSMEYMYEEVLSSYQSLPPTKCFTIVLHNVHA